LVVLREIGFDPVQEPLEAALESTLVEEQLARPVEPGYHVLADEVAEFGQLLALQLSLEEAPHFRVPAAPLVLDLTRFVEGEAEDVVVDQRDQFEFRRRRDVEAGAGAQRLLEGEQAVGDRLAAVEAIERPPVPPEGLAGVDGDLAQAFAPIS